MFRQRLCREYAKWTWATTYVKAVENHIGIWRNEIFVLKIICHVSVQWFRKQDNYNQSKYLHNLISLQLRHVARLYSLRDHHHAPQNCCCITDTGTSGNLKFEFCRNLPYPLRLLTYTQKTANVM